MIQLVRANNRRASVTVLAVLSMSGVWAQTPPADVPTPETVTLTQEDLAKRSDTELTALTAQWGQLSPEQRRRLLAEVRGRMVNNQRVRRPQGVIVQRRYGRVVRKSDGSVVVQTRVVQITPRIVGQKGNTGSGRVTFGIGFEQRARVPGQVAPQVPEAETTQPAVAASQDTPVIPPR